VATTAISAPVGTRWSSPILIARSPWRSVSKRVMTPAILSSSCARRRSPRTSHRISTAAVRRSTTAPPAIPAMRSRRVCTH